MNRVFLRDAALAASILCAALSGCSGPTPANAAMQQQLPAAIDPQRVQDQDDMKWSDYKPIPGHTWSDPGLVPTRKQFRIALIAIDFEDQPFVITNRKGTEIFGNPQVDAVPREKVAQYYADFFNKPLPVNHNQTINGYWMEMSRGRTGIAPLDVYGPYRMPKKLYQYGLNEYGQEEGAPFGARIDGRMEPDADTLWAKDAGADVRSRYDVVLRIYAGYDETGVWQEFGEMKFADSTSIPAEWGNPDPSKPRWVATRYVPWTSWKAGQMQWGISSVRQGENSGTITHELAHNTFGVGDNNNNPYVKPYRRVGTGVWDIMDRGSFNGPGGPHRRWVVPPTEGAAMPAGLMLRSRMLHDFVEESELLRLNRNGLSASGIVVARVVARAVAPPGGQLAGIAIALDGDAPQDRTPEDDPMTNPLSAGTPNFNFYTLEVVQRIGYDSFTPDNGVLITKNKYGRPNDGTSRGRAPNAPVPPLTTVAAFAAGPQTPNAGRGGAAGGGRGGSCGGYNCFAWVIDAHPEDINKLDFVKANGERVMRTVADYRQLNDALFHAGTNSGSSYEWQDTPNRLHFYVVDIHHDAAGILSYTVAVKALDGAGPQLRGVAIATAPAQRVTAATGTCTFAVRNTGAAAPVVGTPHPEDATAFLGNDVYRFTATTGDQGWTAHLPNALAAIPFGGTKQVPVTILRAANASASAAVTLTAVSESDATRTATATCAVTR
jgi:M6 family metalloprotease-like protein